MTHILPTPKKAPAHGINADTLLITASPWTFPYRVHLFSCSVHLRITAYVVKVFSMAKSFISVNDKHLCGPLVYLLKNKQHPDGSFQEDNPVYDTSMTVRVHNCDWINWSSFTIINERVQYYVCCVDTGRPARLWIHSGSDRIRAHCFGRGTKCCYLPRARPWHTGNFSLYSLK